MKKLVVLLLALIFVSANIFSQKKVYSKLQKDSVFRGSVKKLVSESSELAPLQEFYMLEDSEGRLFYLNGSNLEPLVNKNIAVSGSLNANARTITASKIDVETKRKEPEVRTVVIPYGFSQVNLNDDPTGTPNDLIPANSQNNLTMILPQPTVSQGLLSIGIKFSNDQSELLSASELQARIYGNSLEVNGLPSAADYFRFASGGKFQLGGNFYGYVTIPYTNENCLQNMGTVWKDAALSMIPAEIRSQYRRFGFFFSSAPSCPGPMGTVGTRGERNLNQYFFYPLVLSDAQEISVFVNIVNHEFGHGLGLEHGRAMTLDGNTYSVGDRASLMTDRVRYPNVYERIALGWYDGRLVFFNGRGSFTARIYTPSGVNKVAKAALIPIYNLDGTPTGDMRILEIRRTRNYYENFRNQYRAFESGLSVRDAPIDASQSASQSVLYDLVIENTRIPNLDNAPLPPNQTWDDQARTGITVTAGTPSANLGMWVTVTQSRGP